MRFNEGRFRACYDAALRTRPHLNGKASLRFVIRRDGSVQRASVSGIDHAPELGACFVKAVTAIGFPKPAGGTVTVLYPWMLGRKTPRRTPVLFHLSTRPIAPWLYENGARLMREIRTGHHH